MAVLGSPLKDRSDLEWLEAALIDLNARLMWLKIKAGVPMSQIDRMIADELDARRQAAVEEDRRRVAAFHEAQFEAARVGHRGPIDRFVMELKRANGAAGD